MSHSACANQHLPIFSITNSNPDILVSPLAIIAEEQNADCTKSVTQDQANLTVATGYTVQLSNPLNDSDVRPNA